MIGLTHGDDVYICVVHSDVIFSCPAQTDFRPGLENLVLFPEAFPFRHEHLKVDDGAR
jgi:hypothetical protein